MTVKHYEQTIHKNQQSRITVNNNSLTSNQHQSTIRFTMKFIILLLTLFTIQTSILHVSADDTEPWLITPSTPPEATIPSTVTNPTVQWKLVSSAHPSLPLMGGGMSSIVCGGYLYLVGNEQNPTNQVYRSNNPTSPTVGAWEQLPPIPVSFSQTPTPAVLCSNSTLYVMGGSWLGLSIVYFIKVSSTDWIAYNYTPWSTRGSMYFTTDLVNEKYWYFGGQYLSTYYSQIYYIDGSSSQQVSTGGISPRAKGAMLASTKNGYLYIIAGELTGGITTNDIWCSTNQASSWTKLSNTGTVLTSRSSFASSSFNGIIYISGGQSTSNPVSTLNDLFGCYELTSNVSSTACRKMTFGSGPLLNGRLGGTMTFWRDTLEFIFIGGTKYISSSIMAADVWSMSAYPIPEAPTVIAVRPISTTNVKFTVRSLHAEQDLVYTYVVDWNSRTNYQVNYTTIGTTQTDLVVDITVYNAGTSQSFNFYTCNLKFCGIQTSYIWTNKVPPPITLNQIVYNGPSCLPVGVDGSMTNCLFPTNGPQLTVFGQNFHTIVGTFPTNLCQNNVWSIGLGSTYTDESFSCIPAADPFSSGFSYLLFNNAQTITSTGWFSLSSSLITKMFSTPNFQPRVHAQLIQCQGQYFMFGGDAASGYALVDQVASSTGQLKQSFLMKFLLILLLLVLTFSSV